MPKLSKYFTWAEAACNDGTKVPEALKTNVTVHAQEMDQIRIFFGAAVRIRSWYRTVEYNTDIGGAPKSKHLEGIACDFTVDGVKPPEVRMVLEGLIRLGWIPQGGIGAYKTFTHYDSSGIKRRWNG